jgi:hypothetical protein
MSHNFKSVSKICILVLWNPLKNGNMFHYYCITIIMITITTITIMVIFFIFPVLVIGITQKELKVTDGNG